MDAAQTEKLKALALAAQKGGDIFTMWDRLCVFQAEANPATVLELIAGHDKTKQERDELRAEVERLRAEREQAARDSFALAWEQALSDAAFYVAGHCANGEHHAETIMGMVAPKLTVIGSAPAAGTEKDAERFRFAVALEDNAETLCAAVLNHAPDAIAIRAEFDAAILAHTKAKEGV